MARQNKRYLITFGVLCILLLFAVVLSIKYGAVTISIDEIFSSLSKFMQGSDDMTLNEQIFMEIRLPRAILSVFVGATLTVGGVLMQGLFRNPIVEPGLVGTSSGAAFGAALYFVLGATFKFNAGEWTLPVAACAGGLLSTALVFSLSSSRNTGKSTLMGLLLTGIAINALGMSGVGFLSYIARDPQARSIIFWNLGTLSGANWHSVMIIGTTTVICVLGALRYARPLNALMIGEEEAHYLGIKIKRIKLVVLLINVVMVAVATAFVGVIGFVGLIVPHLLRIIHGSDNRYLIINGVLLGAVLLCASDLTARMMFSPAELPIGIVTSVIGVPVFVLLLRRSNYLF